MIWKYDWPGSLGSRLWEREKFACKRFIGKCCQDQPLLGNEGSWTEQRKESNCDAFAAKSSGSGLAFQESLMLGPGYWDFIPLIPWHQPFTGHELSQEEAVVLNKEVLIDLSRTQLKVRATISLYLGQWIFSVLERESGQHTAASTTGSKSDPQRGSMAVVRSN